MKKICFSIILLSFAAVLKAQTYVPFPASHALWTERTGAGDLGPTYHVFGLKNSDTTINAITYHKLYRSEDSTFTENEFYGGLREQARRVYLFEMGNERLIYDFNLNEGDTFRNSGVAHDGVVSNIDSVNIGGQYRKRYSFNLIGGVNLAWSGTWIEGIGNSGIGGLIHTLPMQPTGDYATDNICARVNNTWIYHNPEYSSSSCYSSGLSLDNPSARNQVTLIVPNPVTDLSRLVVEGNIKFDRMDVYDCRGIKIRTYTCNGKNTVFIDRETYVSGLYLYRLSDRGSILGNGKFIVP